MLDFARYYPECRQVILDINYRSKSDIVKHAANLISHNQNRFIKNVCANEKEPGIFKIHPYTSREEEMQNIILLIQQYMKREQAHYSDLALIYRCLLYTSVSSPLREYAKFLRLQMPSLNIIMIMACSLQDLALLPYARIAGASVREEMKPYSIMMRNHF